MVAVDPSVANQTGLFPGENLAAAAEHRRGRGEEHCLCSARKHRDSGGLRVAPEGNRRGRGGGEAMVCEARLIDGLSDAQVRAQFDAARDEDYEAIAKEGRALSTALDTDGTPEKRAELRTLLGRLRKRFAEVLAIDFFGANGREPVEGLLSGVEARVTEGKV